MLKDNIYNEIEKANTYAELIEIKGKIIRAEHYDLLTTIQWNDFKEV